jgi:hypothetical protein
MLHTHTHSHTHPNILNVLLTIILRLEIIKNYCQGKILIMCIIIYSIFVLYFIYYMHCVRVATITGEYRKLDASCHAISPIRHHSVIKIGVKRCVISYRSFYQNYTPSSSYLVNLVTGYIIKNYLLVAGIDKNIETKMIEYIYLYNYSLVVYT